MMTDTPRSARYRVERLLGEGGMGSVHLATDLELDRPVAIKRFHTRLLGDAQAVERFLREARLQAAVRHPHLIPLYDSLQEEDEVNLVMEYVEGEPLHGRIEAGDSLAAPELARLAREVGGALAALHRQGVVHRDVKASNVLVAASDGRFLLMDLGLARTVDVTQLTGSGKLVGTPRYFPPEVLRGEAADARSDQYQLALLLSEAARGRVLSIADAGGAEEFFRRVAAGDGHLLAGATEGLPGSLAGVLERALQGDPGGRFESVERLVEEVVAATRPPPPWAPARSPRGVRRRPPPDESPGAQGPFAVWLVIFGVALLGRVLAWWSGPPPPDLRGLVPTVAGDRVVVEVPLDGAPPLIAEAEGELLLPEPSADARWQVLGRLPGTDPVRVRLRAHHAVGPWFVLRAAPPAVAGRVRPQEGRRLAVALRRPLRIRLAEGTGTWEERPAGPIRLPVPPGPSPTRTVEWRERGALFRRPVELASLVDELVEHVGPFLRYPPVDGQKLLEADPVGRREHGRAHQRLVSWAPLLLSAALPVPASAQLLEGLQRSYQVLAATRHPELGSTRDLPPGMPGSHFLGLPPWAPEGTVEAPIRTGEADAAGEHGVLHPTLPGVFRLGATAMQGSRGSLRLEWPRGVPRRNALLALSLEVPVMAPSLQLELRVLPSAAGGAPVTRLYLFVLCDEPPLRVGDGQGLRFEKPSFLKGWLSLCIPAELAPPPGATLEVRAHRLVGTLSQRANVGRLRVSWTRDPPALPVLTPGG